jgi:hypothetical protein
MSKVPKLSREDEMTLRLLKTPPQPYADMKAKKKPSANKAKAKKG